MSENFSKGILAAEALLLLLPLTLIAALLVLLSYPAYPLPDPRPIQLVFDLAMLFQLLALVAGWRMVILYLRSGRHGLRGARTLWIILLVLGAVIGLAGAFVAVEHVLNSGTARDSVGFALLAPGAVLSVLAGHLLWERRRVARVD